MQISILGIFCAKGYWFGLGLLPQLSPLLGQVGPTLQTHGNGIHPRYCPGVGRYCGDVPVAELVPGMKIFPI